MNPDQADPKEAPEMTRIPDRWLIRDPQGVVVDSTTKGYTDAAGLAAQYTRRSREPHTVDPTCTDPIDLTDPTPAVVA